jgi:hypothetical protein
VPALEARWEVDMVSSWSLVSGGGEEELLVVLCVSVRGRKIWSTGMRPCDIDDGVLRVLLKPLGRECVHLFQTRVNCGRVKSLEFSDREARFLCHPYEIDPFRIICLWLCGL